MVSNKELHWFFSNIIFNFSIELKIVPSPLGKKLWISVDETTDREGRKVAAVLLRTLEDNPSRPYMIQAFELDKTNGETIFHAVDDGIRLFGDAIRREDVLALLTDAAAYMKRAGMSYLYCSVSPFHLF